MDIHQFSDKTVSAMRRKKASFWTKTEKLTRLELAKKAQKSVPAYAEFLKKNHISTKFNFTDLPQTSKKSYLREYPLKKLTWNGTLKTPLVFTSTSGSTGEPFYFPRGQALDAQSSAIHQLFLENNKQSIEGPALVLICFGMGVWIGGLITYQAFEMMREKGYPISILTPGINKHEIFRAIKGVGKHFSQIIMIGYAPFMKDIIDEAPDHGINFKKINTRFIFAAEAFTEKFRSYITKHAHVNNALLDTMNIYGSADIGSMAFETPISIFARRLAMTKPKLFKDIFGHIDRTPTLAQYNPSFISFEAINGEILLTGNNTIPLIRYNIGDHGGVITFPEIVKKFKKHGYDLIELAKKAGISNYIYEMPFVFVYERTDLSTTLYGLQIYPETIREALLEEPFHEYFTGKVTLITKFSGKQDQYLEVNLELRKNKKAGPTLMKRARAHITTHLRMKNSEFHHLYSFLGERANPKLIAWPSEHPLHFTSGIKQKWVKK